MIRVKIAGTGSYLPERVVPNDELAQKLPQTSDEWIFSHTGIRSRHIAAPNEAPSDMGAIAATRALEMAGITPEEVGFIIVSSTTGDYAPLPQTSCVIQHKIGAKNAVCFDVGAACCGFIFNLEIARHLMNNEFHRKPILVIATEMMSRKVDWNDHKTCVLFGDGAGAVVLLPSESESGVLDTYMKTDGSGFDFLKLEGGCRLPPEEMGAIFPHLQMEGKKVFTYAVKAMPEVLTTLLERNNLQLADIKKIVPHQANYRIIHSAGTRVGLPDDFFFLNIEHVANTASASIPIALDEMNRGGMLQSGDKIVTASFGAGFSYGGNLIVW